MVQYIQTLWEIFAKISFPRKNVYDRRLPNQNEREHIHTACYFCSKAKQKISINPMNTNSPVLYYNIF